MLSKAQVKTLYYDCVNFNGRYIYKVDLTGKITSYCNDYNYKDFIKWHLLNDGNWRVVY